jgi:FixJ family two-component response regulator
MITLTEYLQKTYPARPKGLIKGLTEAEQKVIAKQLKTKPIKQVALEFGIEYETVRRIYHKYKGE